MSVVVFGVSETFAARGGSMGVAARFFDRKSGKTVLTTELCFFRDEKTITYTKDGGSYMCEDADLVFLDFQPTDDPPPAPDSAPTFEDLADWEFELIQLFAWSHLKPEFQPLARKFAEFAHLIAAQPANPMRRIALEALVKAKDAAVRIGVVQAGRVARALYELRERDDWFELRQKPDGNLIRKWDVASYPHEIRRAALREAAGLLLSKPRLLPSRVLAAISVVLKNNGMEAAGVGTEPGKYTARLPGNGTIEVLHHSGKFVGLWKPTDLKGRHMGDVLRDVMTALQMSKPEDDFAAADCAKKTMTGLGVVYE